MAFNSTAHNKPHLVRDLLENFIFPILYHETEVNPALMREVVLGPLKHKVDDGLDSRKCTFECLYTLLEKCRERIQAPKLLECVFRGLEDDYNIQMLNFMIIDRLCVEFPDDVVFATDKLTLLLKKIIDKEMGASATAQEREKNDELKRSALSPIVSMKRLCEGRGKVGAINVDLSQGINQLINTARTNPQLKRRLMSVEDPSSSVCAMDLS